MGSGVRPEPDLDALIEARRKALASQGGDVDALIAARRQALGGTGNRHSNAEQFGGVIAGAIPFGAKVLAAIDAANALLVEGKSTREAGAQYTATRDRIMDAEAEGLEQHPVAGRVTQLAAGALPFVAGGAAARAAGAVPEAATAALSTGQRILQGARSGATTGAAFGAAMGAGRARGGVGDYARQIAKESAVGAGLGGVMGGAVPAIGAAGRSALERTGVLPREIPAGATDAALPAPRTTPPPSPARAEVVQGLLAKLDPETRSYALRDPQFSKILSPSPVLEGPVQTARPLSSSDRVLLRALLDEGLTPAKAIERVRAQQAAGPKPELLAEVIGQRGTRLLRTARAASPKAGSAIDNTLEERANAAGARAIADALETSGIQERSNAFRTVQQLAEERGKEADNAFGAVFEAYRDQPITDPRLQEVLATPAGASAWKRALRMMQNKGISVPKATDTMAAPPGVDPEAWANMVNLARERGMPVPEGPSYPTPTLQQAHYLKLALDDEMRPGLNRGEGQGGLGYNEGLSVREVQQKLLAAMDAHASEYGKARSSYADKSRLMDAAETGRNLFKVEPEEFEQALAEMGSEAEREVARRAGMDALARRIENGPADPSKPVQKVREQQRVRLLFPDDESFAAFRQRIAREAQMHKTKTYVSGGSQTADKLADLVELVGAGPVSGQDVVNLATGRFDRIAGKLLTDQFKARMQGVTRETAEGLADDLTTSTPTAQEDVLRRLSTSAREASEQRTQRQSRRLRVVGKAAGISGGLASDQTTRRRKP